VSVSLNWRNIFTLFFLLPIALTSCKTTPPPSPKTCQSCHVVTLDTNHTLDCQACHGGLSPAANEKAAHQGLTAKPAAPADWDKSCGGCHKKAAQSVRQSIHLTLAGYEKFRAGYGGKPVTGIENIPTYARPKTSTELADDLLRRRCLRCHLFYTGEDYAATRHGLGCAACHTRWRDGKMASHQFVAVPGDEQCLACHYGNRVGADYHGFFEHDLPPDFRTPFLPVAKPPFGVESHRLVPDIHQRRGLICVDCHRGGELMATSNDKASCAACHDPARLAVRLPVGVSKKDGGFVFTARSGAIHPLPTLRHEAHRRYGKTVSCQVCHAQWAFADEGIHLIRIDDNELDKWSPLQHQGVAELDRLFKDVLFSEKDPGPPMMSDPFTGERRPGVWLLAYGQRRWENIRLGHVSGKLVVLRPAHDMFLSWTDTTGEVRFDNFPLAGDNNKLIPYTPHTTGAAGIFWQGRLRGFQLQKKDKQ